MKVFQAIAMIGVLLIIIISLVTAWDMEHQTQNTEHQTQNTEHETFPLTTTVIVMIGIGTLIFQFASLHASQTPKQSSPQEVTQPRQVAGVAIAKALDAETSVLRNITVWLEAHRHGNSSTDSAASLFRHLLGRLEEQFDLHQIGNIGDQVIFDFDQHRTLGSIRPGEYGYICEPGWRVGKIIVSKALVEGGVDHG